jgi:small subunit ribosomal protein S15
MPLTKERIQEIVVKHGTNEKDSGRTEVQIALLTQRITDLNEHLKGHHNDHHTRYGLLKLVGQRKSMLTYLKTKNVAKYRELIKDLGIRK